MFWLCSASLFLASPSLYFTYIIPIQFIFYSSLNSFSSVWLVIFHNCKALEPLQTLQNFLQSFSYTCPLLDHKPLPTSSAILNMFRWMPAGSLLSCSEDCHKQRCLYLFLFCKHWFHPGLRVAGGLSHFIESVLWRTCHWVLL